MSTLEGLHKITTVVNKPHGRPSYTKKNKKVMMDISRSDYIKKARIIEELSVS